MRGAGTIAPLVFNGQKNRRPVRQGRHAERHADMMWFTAPAFSITSRSCVPATAEYVLWDARSWRLLLATKRRSLDPIRNIMVTFFEWCLIERTGRK